MSFSNYLPTAVLGGLESAKNLHTWEILLIALELLISGKPA